MTDAWKHHYEVTAIAQNGCRTACFRSGQKNVWKCGNCGVGNLGPNADWRGYCLKCGATIERKLVKGLEPK